MRQTRKRIARSLIPLCLIVYGGKSPCKVTKGNRRRALGSSCDLHVSAKETESVGSVRDERESVWLMESVRAQYNRGYAGHMKRSVVQVVVSRTNVLGQCAKVFFNGFE